MVDRSRVIFRTGYAALTLMACAVALHLPRASASPEAAEPIDRLTIIAPSAPGGGYDLTAQAMKRVLERTGVALTVEVTRSPGAGGLLGLAELVSAHAGDARTLLIGGMVMMGAATSNRATISLLDATPVARLTGEYDVLAVPAASPYRTLDDLLEAMQATPGVVRWVGGSAGGADEQLMWSLARAAGVDPHLMHYTALPGGGEIISQLVSGRFVAGVSGIVEFERPILTGALRGLAVSSPRRLAGVDIPTFDELGVTGLSMMNWRGVFAAPGVSDEERTRLETAIARMVASPEWKAELARHHWDDAHLSGAAFAAFVAARHHHARVNAPAESPGPRVLPSALARRFMWGLVASAAALGLSLVLCLQNVRSRRREVALRRTLREVRLQASRNAEEVQGMLAGVSSHIEREFDRWGLSCAERGVAHLMLKGLRLNDIATMRSTSCRTVRQQAQAIYRKAGLEGRSDLSAYFLEEFLAPAALRGVMHARAVPAHSYKSSVSPGL